MRQPKDLHVGFLNAKAIHLPLDYLDTFFKLVHWVEISSRCWGAYAPSPG